MKWLKKNLINLVLIGVFLVGVGLLLYPTLSDYWNQFHQSRAIAGYAEAVANMDDADYGQMLSEAEAYNEKLAESGSLNFNLSGDALDEYNSVLDITGTGIMGYIEIEKINCSLPIYHGTDDAVLQIAIGHIAGTSLPVGGTSTHCVLSGHRGLPSAKLFTDLDQMEIGDTFVIRTLDEVLTYEVDDIRIVLPAEVDTLGIVEGEDLCTLVTCTPYGVNTHRLLVTGHRVENAESAIKIRVTSDAEQIETIIVAPLVAIPILLILIIIVMISTSSSRRKRREMNERRKQLITGQMGKSREKLVIADDSAGKNPSESLRTDDAAGKAADNPPAGAGKSLEKSFGKDKKIREKQAGADQKAAAKQAREAQKEAIRKAKERQKKAEEQARAAKKAGKRK